jgi:aryl-alcohol dehydrogenase-like predicted oxidoreductase
MAIVFAPLYRRLSAYDELEAVMRKETLDFVQLNYSLDDRVAERKLLPLAAERGIAILVNVATYLKRRVLINA